MSLPIFFFFFFNDTATTEIYTLSLHDAVARHQRERHRRGHGDARPRSRPPGALPGDRAAGGCAGLRLGGGRTPASGRESVRVVLGEAPLICRRAALLSPLPGESIAFWH